LKDGRDRMLEAHLQLQVQIVARRFSHRRQDLDADLFRRRLERAQTSEIASGSIRWFDASSEARVMVFPV